MRVMVPMSGTEAIRPTRRRGLPTYLRQISHQEALRQAALALAIPSMAKNLETRAIQAAIRVLIMGIQMPQPEVKMGNHPPRPRIRRTGRCRMETYRILGHTVKTYQEPDLRPLLILQFHPRTDGHPVLNSRVIKMGKIPVQAMKVVLMRLMLRRDAPPRLQEAQKPSQTEFRRRKEQRQEVPQEQGLVFPAPDRNRLRELLVALVQNPAPV